MGNEIRSEVLASIAKIQASDKGDNSRIDTENEYNSLWDYYHEHEQELESTDRAEEKNLILKLLDEAKNFLKELNQKAESTGKKTNDMSTNNDEDPNYCQDTANTTQSKRTDSEPDDNYGTEKSNNNNLETKSKRTDMPSDYDDGDQKSDEEYAETSNEAPDAESAGDGDYKNCEDTNINNNRGTRRIINGKICVVMPDGSVYNALTGQRVE